MADEQAYNWRLKGHKKQIELLEKAIRNKRLAHAYIFSGPQYIGKRTIGRRIAQFLLCASSIGCDGCIQCKTFTAGSNADFIEISIDDAIKIEHVRDLGYKLSLKPYAGAHKIAVIDNAHNLTIEAANALLKVLEEPKPHTLIILITDNANRLLPTITSRAQRINFGPLDEQTFSEWLKEQNFSQPDPSFAGRPGYVMRISENVETETKLSENLATFHSFNSGSLGEKLLLAADLADKETSDLKSLLDFWLHHLQGKLRAAPSITAVNKIKGLMKAQRQLDQNINTKLLLSELMVSTN